MSEIKRKAKKAAAVSAIWLGGLSAGSKAMARDVKPQDKEIDKSEVAEGRLQKGLTMEEAYWDKYYNGEGKFYHVYSANEEPGVGVYFSSRELAHALSVSGVSREQCEVFAKAYANTVDKDGKITPEDLLIVFKRSKFSVEQAKKFNDALCEGEKKKERLPALRKQEAGSHGQVHSVERKNVSVKYSFGEDRLKFSGTVSANTAKLLPDVCDLEDGSIRCGNGPRAY